MFTCTILFQHVDIKLYFDCLGDGVDDHVIIFMKQERFNFCVNWSRAIRSRKLTN